MMFAIKAAVSDVRAETYAFNARNTMYGGKHIARDDIIFVFASENEGGPRLIDSGVVTSAEAIAKKRGDRPANAARQHHHQTRRAREAAPGTERAQTFFRLERRRPETELNFKFYRQATNKIVGISDKAAAFLRGFFLTRGFRNEHGMG